VPLAIKREPLFNMAVLVESSENLLAESPETGLEREQLSPGNNRCIRQIFVVVPYQENMIISRPNITFRLLKSREK